MSIFTKLNKSDVTEVPYSSNKQWNVSYCSYPTSNEYIVIYNGTKTTGIFDPDNDIVTEGQFDRNVYDSINHLFYQSYSGSLLDTSSLMYSINNYPSASQQRPTQSYFIYNENPGLIKHFPSGSGNGIRVLAVNQNIFGSKLLPYHFQLSSSVYFVVDDGVGNIYDISLALGGYISSSYVNEYYFHNLDPTLFIHVGNVFYSHGLAVITNQDYQSMFPLPPFARNDFAYFTSSISPKKLYPLANDLGRTGTLLNYSIILSGSQSSYFIDNGDGSLTLNTTTAGTYTTYYTVDASISGSCGVSLTSNVAKITATVTN